MRMTRQKLCPVPTFSHVQVVYEYIMSSVHVTLRSAKQCRHRYEGTLVPREEGRILYDMNPRKQKKTKGIYKVYNVSFY